MNYFFGIDATSGKLVADFEEARAGAPGQPPDHRHGASSPANVWHHAAATYDGTTWQLLPRRRPRRHARRRPARARGHEHPARAVGTALNSSRRRRPASSRASSTRSRIWNVARSQAQIQAAKNTEITAPQAGLIGALAPQRRQRHDRRRRLRQRHHRDAPPAAGRHVGRRASTSPTAGTALQLNGSNQYVTFGTAATASCGAATFTLELWFKRTGAGVGQSTGTGGHRQRHPADHEGSGRGRDAGQPNMNYFFGIDATTGTLVADFEEAPTDGAGLNHPITGTAVISRRQRLASRRRDLRRHDLEPLSRRRPRRHARRRAAALRARGNEHPARRSAPRMNSSRRRRRLLPGRRRRGRGSGTSPAARPRSRPPRTPRSPRRRPA